MGRRVIRAPGVPRPSAPKPRVPWRLVLSLGVAVVAVATAATVVGLALQAEAPYDATGTTNRVGYTLVQPGQTQSQVIDLLGSPPRAVESVPLLGDPPRCYVYDRRSGRPGHYRFCFHGGLMVSKSRLGWPTEA